MAYIAQPWRTDSRWAKLSGIDVGPSLKFTASYISSTDDRQRCGGWFLRDAQKLLGKCGDRIYVDERGRFVGELAKLVRAKRKKSCSMIVKRNGAIIMTTKRNSTSDPVGHILLPATWNRICVITACLIATGCDYGQFFSFWPMGTWCVR